MWKIQCFDEIWTLKIDFLKFFIVQYVILKLRDLLLQWCSSPLEIQKADFKRNFRLF